MSNAVPEPRSASRQRVSRLAESAVARARLSVVPRARTETSRLPFLALVTLVLVAGVVGLLLFNTSMQQASFTASTLEDRAEALTAQQQDLSLQLENLRNPQRIADKAQAMGMVIPAAWCSLELSTQAPACTDPGPTPGSQVRLHALPPTRPAILARATGGAQKPASQADRASSGNTPMASPFPMTERDKNSDKQRHRTRSGDQAPR